MLLFNESDLPPGVPEEVMHGVNTVIAGLRGRLVKEIVLPEGPLGLRVPNLVRGYLQAHLRRMLTFLDGGYPSVIKTRHAIARGLTRGHSGPGQRCDRVSSRDLALLTA
jgi:hypothetical protein